jgi:hypothetical protein
MKPKTGDQIDDEKDPNEEPIDEVDIPGCCGPALPGTPNGHFWITIILRFIFLRLPGYIIFYIIILPFILCTSILMWIPWTLIKSTRPYSRDSLDRIRTKGGRKIRKTFDAHEWDHMGERVKDFQMTFDLPGRGYEAGAMYRDHWKTKDEKGREIKGQPAGIFTIIWRGWVGRSWGMYTIFRESFRTVDRQGLQVVGILSAMAIIFMQVWMMYDDLHSSAVCFRCQRHEGGPKLITGA